MISRKKTLGILASVAAGVLVLGAAAAAPGAMRQRHGGEFGGFGFGRGMARALASLDLTDDQKTQAKAILKEEGPRVEPLIDDLMRSKKAVFEAVHAPEFDEKAVRVAASGSAKATTELAVERARIMSKFRDILTSEQQERLDAIQQRFEERLEKRVGTARSIWREHAADFIDAL